MADFCKQSIGSIETIIHPRAPTLYFPVFNTSISDIMKSRSNKNEMDKVSIDPFKPLFQQKLSMPFMSDTSHSDKDGLLNKEREVQSEQSNMNDRESDRESESEVVSSGDEDMEETSVTVAEGESDKTGKGLLFWIILNYYISLKKK